MKDDNIRYWKDESLADWIKRYREEHGRNPEKPIYCDYRSIEEFQREIILIPSQNTEEWMVEDYEAEKHGEIDERYHKFIPYRGRN